MRKAKMGGGMMKRTMMKKGSIPPDVTDIDRACALVLINLIKRFITFSNCI